MFSSLYTHKGFKQQSGSRLDRRRISDAQRGRQLIGMFAGIGRTVVGRTWRHACGRERAVSRCARKLDHTRRSGTAGRPCERACACADRRRVRSDARSVRRRAVAGQATRGRLSDGAGHRLSTHDVHRHCTDNSDRWPPRATGRDAETRQRERTGDHTRRTADAVQPTMTASSSSARCHPSVLRQSHQHPIVMLMCFLYFLFVFFPLVSCTIVLVYFHLVVKLQYSQ